MHCISNSEASCATNCDGSQVWSVQNPLRSEVKPERRTLCKLHGQAYTNLSPFYPSSYPSHRPGPGPANCHRVTPAHSDFSIPPAQHQPATPLYGIPTAWPATPSTDVSPASHPLHISGLRHHTPQRQCRQPQRGGRRDTHQRPVHTQPHQHGLQIR